MNLTHRAALSETHWIISYVSHRTLSTLHLFQIFQTLFKVKAIAWWNRTRSNNFIRIYIKIMLPQVAPGFTVAALFHPTNIFTTSKDLTLDYKANLKWF